MQTRSNTPSIVFMGTPDFAVPSLDALVKAGHKPSLVVTTPDRKKGRGLQMQPSAVAEAAARHLIPTIKPENLRDPEFAAEIAAVRPDVMVVVAFRILPEEIYSMATIGAFNLHASLLPRWRGAAPINRAIMAGEMETGVTTFLLQPRVDVGDIILARRIPIGPDDTAGDIHDKLATLGAHVVVQTVSHLLEGTAETRPQDNSRATTAPKIFREDARIPWNREADEVHNHVRGLSPYPAAWTKHGDTLIKIRRTKPARGMGEPGEILEAQDDRLVVACETGALRVIEIQREGGKSLDAGEFLKGYSLRPGDRFV